MAGRLRKGQLGELRDRTFENQVYRASGLNLVVAAVILWNTRYLELAAADLGIGPETMRHVALQTEIPAFTRVADYDVLVVADEANAFSEYLPGHTALPRPVVGAHGMLATA